MKKTYLLLIVFVAILFPSFVGAADFYMILDKTQVSNQGTFSGTVYVSTGGLPINNAEATIHFPADIISVDSVSIVGSIFNIWVEQPTFSNTAGTIYFNGGVPTPGYSGQSGRTLQINFRAKKSGTANIAFGISAIRANDGSGTNIIAGARGATVNVISSTVPVSVPPTVAVPEVAVSQPGLPRAPVIVSNDMPDQNAWYNRINGTFTWDLPGDVTAVQLVLSVSPNTTPSVLYEVPISGKTLTDLGDGVVYLNARFRNSIGWGRITSRKIQIDTVEPENLIVKTSVTENDLISVEASAEDKLSGIKNYVAYINGEKVAESPASESEVTKFDLPPFAAGNLKLAVRAYDKAGNYTETNVSVDAPPAKSPKITHYPEYVKVGSKIEIRGKSPYPNTEINIWLKEEGKDAKNYLVRSDEDKVFSYTSDVVGTPGTVSVWAETKREGNVVSSPSEKIYISVKESDAVWLGTRAIQVLSILITLLVLLFSILALVTLGIRRMNALKRKVRRDLVHTEQEVHKVFEILKGDTKRHLRMLERASRKRKLSKEESTILSELAEGLDETEKYLSKEIKSIAEKDL